MDVPRAARVVTEVTAVDRVFDYEVTPTTQHANVGDRVRVNLHGRSVRGWVSELVDAQRELKPLTKWLGFGPAGELRDLLYWASERWCAPVSRFFLAASPTRNITALPAVAPKSTLSPRLLNAGASVEPGVIELSPTTDPLDIILHAYERSQALPGSLLVLVPTESWAQRLSGRLQQRGCAVAQGDQDWAKMRAGWPVIVGARGTALSPNPRVSAAVMVDADDEAYRSAAAPTWHAADVLLERCRRDVAPLWLTSALPSPSLLASAPLRRRSTPEGWPTCAVVDRRRSDPHDGALAREVLDVARVALAGDEAVAVVVVLQRLGAGRLYACRRCGELARCATCQQAEIDVDGQLACVERHEPRAVFCRSCGATSLRSVRSGVTTLARDIGLQLSCAVTEISASTPADEPLARVVVGTENVWQRVRRCELVVFADFDQYLLAPRETARRQAILAVAKAGRLVGGRDVARGRVMVQTRRGDDTVLEALRRGEMDSVMKDEVETARALGLYPYRGVAEISGEAAPAYVASLVGVNVARTADGFVVTAPDTAILTAALRNAERPPGKMRIAVT